MKSLPAWISVNIDKKITTSIMAKKIGKSRAHFCRAWKSTMGMTPMEYVTKVRLEKARDMVESTDLKLSAIALDCGFASHAHMTGLFREVFGRAPSSMRRATLEASKLSLLIFGFLAVVDVVDVFQCFYEIMMLFEHLAQLIISLCAPGEEIWRV